MNAHTAGAGDLQVMVVGAPRISRAAIAARLRRAAGIAVVAETDDPAAATTLALSAPGAIAVLDERLPDLDTVASCRALVAAAPSLPLVVIAPFDHASRLIDACAAGAVAFVAIDAETATLIDAVRAAAEGRSYVDARLGSQLVAYGRPVQRTRSARGLTRQELRVVQHFTRGLTNREIGVELGITEHTVKSHVHNALRKLGARDRVHAAALVLRSGLV